LNFEPGKIRSVPAQETSKRRARFGWPAVSDVAAVTKPRREILIIGRIVTNEQGMEPLTDDEMARHDSATTCEVCRKPFTKKNHKVMHHDHITGFRLSRARNIYP